VKTPKRKVPTELDSGNFSQAFLNMLSIRKLLTLTAVFWKLAFYDLFISRLGVFFYKTFRWER